ncbi:MAG: sigma-54-dependent Fis family transcriptional regulator [Planctomycetes bacterium]|nr:sigma-54-dependent Fis family transcriptional regulator [Planctomycetota bacterium]
MKLRILIVDDEAAIRDELAEALDDAGYETARAPDGAAAAALIAAEAFDLCVSDVRMPGMGGIELLRHVARTSPETLVLLMTAHAELQSAIEALRLGAVDYLQKPFKQEELLARVGRLAEHRKLVVENRNLRRSLESSVADRAAGIVGDSPAMRRVLEVVDRVASLPSNVLIVGESGTGKDLVAHALHERGSRAAAPFVPINCAAIPEALLEGELFGHVKGAFTGASDHKEGLLRTAGEGTIFLDELGELPLALQAKLLRALESREIQPIGSTRRVPIHARIVVATNRDLKADVRAGRFREDLYYRLAVVEIEVPPLRERAGDLPLLVDHLLARHARKLGRPAGRMAPEALRRLAGHDWRGNVRELSNVVERALIFARGDEIGVDELPDLFRSVAPRDPEGPIDLREATRAFERAHVLRIIEKCGGNKRQAARLLGLGPSSLYRKLGDAEPSLDDAAPTPSPR